MTAAEIVATFPPIPDDVCDTVAALLIVERAVAPLVSSAGVEWLS